MKTSIALKAAFAGASMILLAGGAALAESRIEKNLRLDAGGTGGAARGRPHQLGPGREEDRLHRRLLIRPVARL